MAIPYLEPMRTARVGRIDPALGGHPVDIRFTTALGLKQDASTGMRPQRIPNHPRAGV